MASTYTAALTFSSTFVKRALSTGEPEVGNYAFTTRGVSLGHVYDGGALAGQVMDTPGLLDRDAAARNAMEDLTMATMDHLPSAVVFVCDLSGHAGERTSSPDAQLAVRDALHRRLQAPLSACWTAAARAAEVVRAPTRSNQTADTNVSGFPRKHRERASLRRVC